jgi:hypothetical protein
VSTNIETEQITNGNLKLKENGSFLKPEKTFPKKYSPCQIHAGGKSV